MNPAITVAREELAKFQKEVNRSAGFGDAEVYYLENGKIVNEGYLGRDPNESDIEVNGVKFKGQDAVAVMR